MTSKNIDPIKTGKFIAELRKSHNLTQDQLGAIIYITRKSVSKWETGAATPTIDMLKKLSEALGVTMDEIVEGQFITTKPFDMNNSDNVDKVNETDLNEENDIEPVASSTKEETLELVEIELENEKEIQPVVHTKEYKKVYEFLQVAFVAFLLVLFIVNLFTPKVGTTTFVVNAEGDNFFIKNGFIVLSNDCSSFNLGNLYNDNEKNQDYTYTLYVLDEDESENMIISFKNIQTYNIQNPENEMLIESFNQNNFDNLYIKISYVTDYEEEISYRLSLKVSAQTYAKDKNIFKNDKLNKNFNPDVSSLGTDNDIDLKFLFDMTEEKIMKIYDGKSFTIADEKYNISYDKKNSSLIIESNKTNILIAFEFFRIYLYGEDIDIISISNDYKVLNLNKYPYFQTLFNQVRAIVER